jgi:hypothetical protein
MGRGRHREGDHPATSGPRPASDEAHLIVHLVGGHLVQDDRQSSGDSMGRATDSDDDPVMRLAGDSVLPVEAVAATTDRNPSAPRARLIRRIGDGDCDGGQDRACSGMPVVTNRPITNHGRVPECRPDGHTDASDTGRPIPRRRM